MSGSGIVESREGSNQYKSNNLQLEEVICESIRLASYGSPYLSSESWESAKSGEMNFMGGFEAR
jgi:hypothetical protein